LAAEPEPAYVAEPEPAYEEPEPAVDDVHPPHELDPPLDVAPAHDEDAAAPADDIEPEEASVAPAVARSALRSLPVLALLLTTILMAVAAGFVWYQVHQHNLTESARTAGLEASRDAARTLLSYDYRTLDKDFAAGKAVTTGAFQKQYADTTAKVVAPVAKDKKAVVKAEVVTAGVVRASANRVVTIVYVNQVTTTSLAAGPKVDLSRVRMTLVRVDGHWRVSKVDAL
jgi:Mce-associated membrane protein